MYDTAEAKGYHDGLAFLIPCPKKKAKKKEKGGHYQGIRAGSRGSGAKRHAHATWTFIPQHITGPGRWWAAGSPVCP